MKITTRICLSVLMVIAIMAPASKAVADNVDNKKARNVASYFMAAQFGNKSITPENIKLVYEIPNVEKGVAALYFFNTADNRGFVVVSGTDCIDPIVAFSTDGPIDPNNIPPAMMWWLRQQANMIAYCQNEAIEPAEDAKASWRTLEEKTLPYFGRSSKVASFLLKTKWNQNYPFNILCPPATNAGSDVRGRAYVGCVATAMSQIMRYWEYPRVGNDTTHTYTCTTVGVDTTLTLNYGEAYFDYEKMPNKVVDTTPYEQIYEIAKLGYHCGVAVNMGYDGDGSGTQSSRVDDAIVAYFKYVKDGLQKLNRNAPRYANSDYQNNPNAKDTTWVNLIVNEIQQRRPVYYSGHSPAGGQDAGHAFVCDGWDAATNTLHFNWGWGGSGDSWCNVYTGQLKPSSRHGNTTYNFTDDHSIIIGITPPQDSIHLVSVEETENPFMSSIYPNPASTQVTVSYMLNDNTHAMMQIFDAAGRMVNQIELSPVSTQVTIPVANLHPGIYFCRINGYTQKFVVR